MSLLKHLHPDVQYKNLVRNILKNGRIKEGRNGNVLSLFGVNMRFSLHDNKVPFLTSKKLAWKSCLKELLWFMNGSTDNKILTEQNVKIWNANADPIFLKSRGLNYTDGDLGPIYGHQWRYFNAEYEGCDKDYTGKGVDQLQNIVDALCDDTEKYSRRLILSAWNPIQLNEMALPPCHILFQFNVLDGNKLCCCLYQRSNDEFLGIPFNIASYSFLTHLIAHHCGLEAYEFIHYGGNCHVYEDHIEQVKTQISRTPYEFPTMEIVEKKENINDYVLEDFKIDNYKHYETIKMNMNQ